MGKYNNYAGQEEEEGEDDKMGTTIYGSGLFVGTLLFTKCLSQAGSWPLLLGLFTGWSWKLLSSL